MIATKEKIKEISERVASAVNADRVILFGSYAWGTPDTDSDLDLYVVVPTSTEPGYRLARKAYRALRGIGIPVDIVIRSREESERNARIMASLDRQVLQNGIVL